LMCQDKIEYFSVKTYFTVAKWPVG